MPFADSVLVVSDGVDGVEVLGDGRLPTVGIGPGVLSVLAVALVVGALAVGVVARHVCIVHELAALVKLVT